MAFDASCRKAGITVSVELFRYLCHILKIARGYYFCSRPKRNDFVIKYSECTVGWKQNYFMVKKENFPTKMCRKESVGKDNNPRGSTSEEEIRKLKAVEGEDMSCLKTTTLEQVGGWWKKLEEE